MKTNNYGKALAARHGAAAALAAAIIMLASCAGKKAVSDTISTQPATAAAVDRTEKDSQAAFLRRTLGNAATTKNIVASADFRLVAGGKDLSCDGKLSMRRDEIIRLQLLLPIIRTEIARVDFTPDYVLLVDRYHKEYIKAAYKDVSFLADNGISFYSLQALFWNQLFLPGEKTVTEAQLKKFACGLAEVSTSVPVRYRSGNIDYEWTADKATAQIGAADVRYSSAQHGTSSLHWTYDNFRTVGGKPFPLSQQFSVKTGVTGKQQSAQLTVKMSAPKTSADWDTATELSAKYKKIEARDILKKLLSIQ